MSAAWQLAEVNVGRLLAPVSDPRIADFYNALSRINDLADTQPGFVWRLKGAGNDASDIQPDPGDPLQAINASVWESPEHLAAFAYRTEHIAFVRRRTEWFESPREAYLALWWVAPGHTPSVPECLERLAHLRANGPTAFAFDFLTRFPPPAQVGSPQLEHNPFPLAGKGQGMGVSAQSSPIGERREPRSLAQAPPPPTPPRKGEGSPRGDWPGRPEENAA